MAAFLAIVIKRTKFAFSLKEAGWSQVILLLLNFMVLGSNSFTTKHIG